MRIKNLIEDRISSLKMREECVSSSGLGGQAVHRIASGFRSK